MPSDVVNPASPDRTGVGHVARDQPILVYGRAGVVGAAVVPGMTQAGFSPMSNLDGGLFRWANEGHPLVNESGPATTVHPVAWSWGRLLKSRFHP